LSESVFGTTIFGYVRARRLEIGRILIRDHGLLVAEAGYRVGLWRRLSRLTKQKEQQGCPLRRQSLPIGLVCS